MDRLTWSGSTSTTAGTSTASTSWTLGDHQDSVRDIVGGNASDRGRVVERRQDDSVGEDREAIDRSAACRSGRSDRQRADTPGRIVRRPREQAPGRAPAPGAKSPRMSVVSSRRSAARAGAGSPRRTLAGRLGLRRAPTPVGGVGRGMIPSPVARLNREAAP